MDFLFSCLLVDNAGEPQGRSLLLRVPEDQYLGDLAKELQTQITDIQVPAYRITFWKTNPPFPDSEQSLPMHVKALHPNVTGNQCNVKLLTAGDKLKDVFTLPLPPKHIHIIAQLPPSQ